MVNETKLSKFLCFVLRHRPDKIGIILDDAGWTTVDSLINNIPELSLEFLYHIVSNDSKNRYEFNEDKTKIRARQGHSINVNLGYKPAAPPDILYHGTTVKNKDTILSEGLKKMTRHAVHLSEDIETATKVGIRHGKLLVFEINTKQMYDDGIVFYVTNNNVWLTDNVNPKYLNIKKYSNGN